MAMITNNRIALITSDEGINFESFKTLEDLLRATISFRMHELTFTNRMNPSAAFIQIQREVKGQLNRIVDTEKDEKCPISGAKNCHECPDSQVEKCNGEWNNGNR